MPLANSIDDEYAKAHQHFQPWGKARQFRRDLFNIYKHIRDDPKLKYLYDLCHELYCNGNVSNINAFITQLRPLKDRVKFNSDLLDRLRQFLSTEIDDLATNVRAYIVVEWTNTRAIRVITSKKAIGETDFDCFERGEQIDSNKIEDNLEFVPVWRNVEQATKFVERMDKKYANLQCRILPCIFRINTRDIDSPEQDAQKAASIRRPALGAPIDDSDPGSITLAPMPANKPVTYKEMHPKEVHPHFHKWGMASNLYWDLKTLSKIQTRPIRELCLGVLRSCDLSKLDFLIAMLRNSENGPDNQLAIRLANALTDSVRLNITRDSDKKRSFIVFDCSKPTDLWIPTCSESVRDSRFLPINLGKAITPDELLSNLTCVPIWETDFLAKQFAKRLSEIYPNSTYEILPCLLNPNTLAPLTTEPDSTKLPSDKSISVSSSASIGIAVDRIMFFLIFVCALFMSAPDVFFVALPNMFYSAIANVLPIRAFPLALFCSLACAAFLALAYRTGLRSIVGSIIIRALNIRIDFGLGVILVDIVLISVMGYSVYYVIGIIRGPSLSLLVKVALVFFSVTGVHLGLYCCSKYIDLSADESHDDGIAKFRFYICSALLGFTIGIGAFVLFFHDYNRLKPQEESALQLNLILNRHKETE